MRVGVVSQGAWALSEVCGEWYVELIGEVEEVVVGHQGGFPHAVWEQHR